MFVCGDELTLEMGFHFLPFSNGNVKIVYEGKSLAQREINDKRVQGHKSFEDIYRRISNRVVKILTMFA